MCLCIFALTSLSVLRIHLSIQSKFHWNVKYHGITQGFWIWIEDKDSQTIYHHEYIIFNKMKEDVIDLDWMIPVYSESIPESYMIRIISDYFVGCDYLIPISIREHGDGNRMMPFMKTFYTPILDLTPLPIFALQNYKYEGSYSSSFKFFNPIQTQLFHILYHTHKPVLCCGK